MKAVLVLVALSGPLPPMAVSTLYASYEECLADAETFYTNGSGVSHVYCIHITYDPLVSPIPPERPNAQ